MKVSVVIAAYNRERLIKIAIESLLEQSLPRENYEVIVVDNASTDSTFKVASAYDGVNAVRESRQGTSFARNRGIALAKGDIVAFMDDDAKADRRWLEFILNAFSKHPDAVAVGGKILPYTLEEEIPEWAKELEVRSWGETAGFLDEWHSRYGFSGSNMAFKRTVLEEVGGFPVDMGPRGNVFSLGEETFLFNRLSRIYPGAFFYDPGIVVYHYLPRYKASVFYRLKRSFKAGMSRAVVDGKFLFPLKAYMNDVRYFFPLALKKLLSSFGEKRNSDKIRRLQEAFNALGYLCRGIK